MIYTRNTVFDNMFPNQKPFQDNPKARRLAFMKTRFNKPKCKCGKNAKYKLIKLAWCNDHLPEELRDRLSMDWQMSKCILPYAWFLEKQGL